MPKIKQFKDNNNNTTYDIYGQNVKTLDWDDYTDLPSAQKNSDTAFFVPDAPSGITLIPQTVPNLPANIASFSDGADNEPLAKLEVGIEAVQSGSGEPSPQNMRPISGWSAVNVTDCGQNIFDADNLETLTVSSSSFKGHKFTKAGSYAVKAYGTSTNNYLYARVKNADNTWESVNYIVAGSTTTPAIITITDGKELYVYDAVSDETSSNKFKNWQFQVAVGTTQPPTYELYNGTTYTIQLGDTYYGGELDVTTGELSVKYKKIKISDLNWTYSSQYTRFISNESLNDIGGDIYSVNFYKDVICEIYSNSSSTNNDTFFVLLSSKKIYIYDNRYTDVTQFIENVGDYKIIYKLATPITYQLTPTQVKSLLKDNNIWAYSGQIKDCTYYKYGQGTKPQLYFNDTVYEGSEVIANPEDATPYTKLDTVYINGITYDINLHGQSHLVDKLYEASDGDGAPLNTDISYLNSHTLSEYDYITVCLCDPTTFAQDKLTQVNSFTSQSLLISDIVTPVTLSTINSGYCCVTFSDNQFNVSAHGADVSTNAPSIYSIYGVMGSGNKVEGNPEGTASETLEKIKIDDTIYDVPDVTITPETIEEPKRKVADYSIDGVSGSIYAPIIQIDGKASGAIASFTDGGDNKPLKSLKVAINPVQASGTPTPENPLPIYGWTGASVTRTGKNLVDIPDFNITSQYYGSYFYLNQGTYTFSINIKNNTAISGNLYLKKRDNSNIALIAISSNMNSRASYTFTISERTEMRITASGSSSGYSYEFKDIQIEVGSTDTDFEPYNGTTYPITWSEEGEVFGGWFNPVDGTGEVTKVGVDLGDKTWTAQTDSQGTYFRSSKPNGMKSVQSGVIPNALCSIYPTTTSTNVYDGSIAFSVGSEGYTFVRDTRFTDATAFKTAMSGVRLVYELATPIPFMIDEPLPTITTLLGNNNLWSDTGDIDEVIYIRDLNLAFNQFDARITALEQALSQ